VGAGESSETKWPTEAVEIATLYEFDENYRFLTTSCDPYMGNNFRLFLHISSYKRHQGWL
jgi:hypothetical protein